MTEQVVLTGPLSPADIAHLLTGRDSSVAESIRGYRGVSMTELVKALVSAGVQVEVVTEAMDVSSQVELEGPRLRVLVAPLRPRARDHILDLFRRERKDLFALLERTEGEVINAHWTYEFAWAALDTRRPVLVTAKDAPMTILRYTRDTYRALRAIMAWRVRMRTRNLSAVSPYLARRWRREMLYRRPIAIIPNCAPTLPVTCPNNTRWSSGALLTIGNFGPLKNIRALVEALSLLRADGRDVSLEIIGEGLGPDEPFAIETRARGLAEGIAFRGRVDREGIAEALSRNSILVHPSLEESFGMVLVEAMSAGLPVVGGVRSGAVPWVLDDGDAGVLVDVKQPSEIARGISGLLDDENEAQAIIARARDRVAKHFSPRVVCEAYLAEYDRLRRERR